MFNCAAQLAVIERSCEELAFPPRLLLDTRFHFELPLRSQNSGWDAEGKSVLNARSERKE